jgi:hypothetical protein
MCALCAALVNQAVSRALFDGIKCPPDRHHEFQREGGVIHFVELVRLFLPSIFAYFNLSTPHSVSMALFSQSCSSIFSMMSRPRHFQITCINPLHKVPPFFIPSSLRPHTAEIAGPTKNNHLLAV